MLGNRDEYSKMAKAEEEYWWYQSLHFLVFKYIIKNFSSKSIEILDAGCGTGGLIKYLKNKGYNNIRGFDLSDDAISYAKDKGINIRKGNMNDILNIYPHQKFDLIISNDNFYHLNEAQKIVYLKNMNLLLNDKGLIFMNLPAFNVFKGNSDLCYGINERYSIKSFNVIVNKTNNLNLIDYRYWPFLSTPFVFIIRLFQRLRNYKFLKSDIYEINKNLNQIFFFFQKLEFFLNTRFIYFGSSLFVLLKKIN